MGILHEGHSKRKINKDPNNTKWSRDTNTFGQKILRAQGWQPGQYLGAQDAPHSELHTSANASYIRVILKDDMKGLGFNRAKEDEVTGLDVFQDLLSRLNGKTEAAVEEDRQARWAIKTHKYVEQKYGPMRFVRGGLLVGDELREEPKEDEKSSEESTSEAEDVEMESTAKESTKDKKSKKRKASDADEDNSDQETESKSKKRRKEERKLKAVADGTDVKKAKRKEKKSKKEKRSKKAAVSSDDEATVEKDKSKKRKSKKSKSQSPEESEDDQVKESKKSKKEKKDKKKRRKEEAETSGSATLVSTPADSTASTGTSTPTLVGTGTSTPQGSRNFVRSRFIAQKRQAVLDTKALAQIFMVKA